MLDHNNRSALLRLQVILVEVQMVVMQSDKQQMGEPVSAGGFWYSNVLRQCRGECDGTGSGKAFFALDLIY